MNFSNLSHPERSGGGKVGGAESKDPAELRSGNHAKADVCLLEEPAMNSRVPSTARRAAFAHRSAPLRMTRRGLDAPADAGRRSLRDRGIPRLERLGTRAEKIVRRDAGLGGREAHPTREMKATALRTPRLSGFMKRLHQRARLDLILLRQVRQQFIEALHRGDLALIRRQHHPLQRLHPPRAIP